MELQGTELQRAITKTIKDFMQEHGYKVDLQKGGYCPCDKMRHEEPQSNSIIFNPGDYITFGVATYGKPAMCFHSTYKFTKKKKLKRKRRTKKARRMVRRT
jgi:hypothetical protein